MSLVSKYLKWKFGGRKWNKFDGNELNWKPTMDTNLWSWFYSGFLVVTPENTTLKQSVVALGVQQINFCWCLWFFYSSICQWWWQIYGMLGCCPSWVIPRFFSVEGSASHCLGSAGKTKSLLQPQPEILIHSPHSNRCFWHFHYSQSQFWVIAACWWKLESTAAN